MSGKVQPNDLQGVFTHSNQQNYTHFTLFSPEASFCRGEAGERKNIGYIQSSSQIRRHLEMHYRAERSALDPIGLNPCQLMKFTKRSILYCYYTTLR